MKEFIKPLIIFGISLVMFRRVLFGGSMTSTDEQETQEQSTESPIQEQKIFQKTQKETTIWHPFKQEIWTQRLFSQQERLKRKDATSLREITIAIPELLFQYGFESFFKQLQEQQIPVTYQTYQSLEDIEQGKFDLILLPYDQKDQSYENFGFQEDLSPFFKEECQELLQTGSIDFLPFGIDPLGFFTFSGNFETFTFTTLWNYIVKREPKNRGIFPLRFGLTSEALREQREGEETEIIFRETLLNFIKHYQDDKTLEARTTLNLNAERPYNEENLEKIYKITKRFDYCENHTPECALMYNLVEIIPSFYSTKNFLQQQFPNKKETLNNLTFFPVPFAKIEEPIRIRWRVIPKNNQDKTTIYRFLENYMNLINTPKINLRTNVVPALSGDHFKNILYDPTLPTKIIQKSEFKEHYQNEIELRQLLDYQISSKEYLWIPS